MRDGLDSLKLSYIKMVPANQPNMNRESMNFVKESNSKNDEHFLFNMIQASHEIEMTNNEENHEFKFNRKLDDKIVYFNVLFAVTDDQIRNPESFTSFSKFF